MALHRLAALVAPLVILLILTPPTALAQAQAKKFNAWVCSTSSMECKMVLAANNNLK